MTARDVASFDETVDAIESAGGAAYALPCDVSDEASVEEIAKAVIERHGTALSLTDQ